MRPVCAALALFAALASAQSSGVPGPKAALLAGETGKARALLQSASLSDQAWGAYLIGRLRLTDLYGDLTSELRAAARMASASSGDEYAYCAALLDAAVEVGLDLPVAVLQPYEERWKEPVLILLAASRDTERESALLRLSTAAGAGAWLAANNLLLERKSQTWYTQILKAAAAVHTITVTDPGVMHGVGESGGGACGDGGLGFRAAFPPINYYELEDHGSAGSVLLAPGPTPAYYRRILVAEGKASGFGSCSSLNQTRERFRYLAALSNQPADRVDSLLRHATPSPTPMRPSFCARRNLR